MRPWIYVLALWSLIPSLTSAQSPALNDTILTLSGRDIPCLIVDSLGLEIRFQVVNKRGKVKQQILDRGEVFSIRNGEENVLYVQDSLIGNWMTEPQVRLFIAGERDARACYSTKGTFWISFGLSATAAYLAQGGLVSSMLMPLAVSGYQLIPVLRIPEECIADKNHMWNDTYALGFEQVARPKRILSALKGGALGMLLGIAGYYIVPL